MYLTKTKLVSSYSLQKKCTACFSIQFR
uniref:Uncharacterized protein n=1 Tax=Anguilla anguilla TaxID=7936 RepID=A0A0E9SSL0_ANGAN